MSMYRQSYSTYRSGTILIIIAGISALLATLALTFLAKNRSDAEATRWTLAEVQARIMMVAACNYIQECSRVGWDRYRWDLPTSDFPVGYPIAVNDAFPTGDMSSASVPAHEETFGWIDVRDGTIGPKTQEGREVWQGLPLVSDGTTKRPSWPAIDGIARCPMYVWKRTKYATTSHACYNPISRNPADADYLMPYLKNPDPLPMQANDWIEHANGDPTPRQHTLGKSWFRVMREGPATFLITCGAGGTEGFRSYQEAEDNGFAHLFNNDPANFAMLYNQEARFWYRVEWSASSAEPTYHWQQHHTQGRKDSYMQWPVNTSLSNGNRSPSFIKNQSGTFRWIMRLRSEPTYW